jgi:hypothetical protein
MLKNMHVSKKTPEAGKFEGAAPDGVSNSVGTGARIGRGTRRGLTARVFREKNERKICKII